MTVLVQEAAFDPGALLNGFAKERTDVGAIVSFTGIVRNTDGDLIEMTIEHYPGMTGPAIAAFADQAKTRWSLQDVMVVHRFGTMKPGETIMMVATAAAHRADAFLAADFLMDYLKSRAPFWKKEVTAQGGSWVAAKTEDEDALNRW